MRARYRIRDPAEDLVAAYRDEYPRCVAAAGRETLAALRELRERIAGAVACGLRSIWISRGRRWQTADYRSDLIADSVPEAARYVLDGR